MAQKRLLKVLGICLAILLGVCLAVFGISVNAPVSQAQVQVAPTCEEQLSVIQQYLQNLAVQKNQADAQLAQAQVQLEKATKSLKALTDERDAKKSSEKAVK